MDAWIWFVFGVVLFVMELFVSTGFYLFILGTACLVVGAAALSGLVVGWMLQSALFSVSAFVLWFFLAERFQSLLRSKEKEYTGMIGQTAIARESIVSGAKGGVRCGAPHGGWRMLVRVFSMLEMNARCFRVMGSFLKLRKRVSDSKQRRCICRLFLG